MSIRVVMILSVMVSLTGCFGQEQAVLLVKPEITEIGEFDGCTVKFVNRGYNIDSFFIARCSDTTVTTRNYTEQSGKTTTARRITVIENEFTPTKEQVKESALSKLSAEERAVLGVK